MYVQCTSTFLFRWVHNVLLQYICSCFRMKMNFSIVQIIIFNDSEKIRRFFLIFCKFLNLFTFGKLMQSGHLYANHSKNEDKTNMNMTSPEFSSQMVILLQYSSKYSFQWENCSNICGVFFSFYNKATKVFWKVLELAANLMPKWNVDTFEVKLVLLWKLPIKVLWLTDLEKIREKILLRCD